MSEVITFRNENEIKLRMGFSPNDIGVWINGTRLDSAIRFLLRQEIDALYVDFTCVAGKVRIMQPDWTYSVESTLSNPFTGDADAVDAVRSREYDYRSAKCVAAVRYAPGEYIPAVPVFEDYRQPWVETRFSVKISPPSMSLTVEGEVLSLLAEAIA